MMDAFAFFIAFMLGYMIYGPVSYLNNRDKKLELAKEAKDPVLPITPKPPTERKLDLNL